MKASQVWLRASLSRVVCVIRAAPDFGRLKRERWQPLISVIHPLADRVRESSAATRASEDGGQRWVQVRHAAVEPKDGAPAGLVDRILELRDGRIVADALTDHLG